MAEEVIEHDLPSPGARRVPTPSDSLSFCLSLLFFSFVPSRPHAVGVRQCDVVRKHWRGPDELYEGRIIGLEEDKEGRRAVFHSYRHSESSVDIVRSTMGESGLLELSFLSSR